MVQTFVLLLNIVVSLPCTAQHYSTMIEEQNIKQLPKDWKWVKLGELCLNKEGLRRGPFGSAIKKEFFVPNGYKVYEQSNAIYNDAFRGRYFLDETKYQELINFNVQPGDLIVSCSGTLGRIAEIPTNAKPGVINQALLRVRLKEELIEKKYFLYNFRSAQFQKKIFDQSQGTAMSNLVGIKDFKLIEISLPPKPTQQAIVSKIEELFSELDKGIEQLKTAQQQLKTYRQSVLKWAFEGKLTRSLNYDLYDLYDAHDLTVAAEPDAVVYELKNNQENQDNHINHSSDKGELPKGWKLITIDEVASVGTGATPLKSKSEYYGGSIAWVTSGALNEEYVREATDFVTEKAVKETNLTIYPKHTLLVAMYGEGKTRGKCSELSIEACTNQAIAAIYFNELQISVKPYLKYFLFKNYIEVRKKSSGGVQPNLNLGIIKKLQFPLPPIEEQNKIVQEIESRLSVADKMEESITQSLQQAEALRQSILKKAFEGKLV